MLDYLDELEMMTRSPKIFQYRHNFYEEHDEISFKTRLRLSKCSATHVLGLIEDKLQFTRKINFFDLFSGIIFFFW